MMPPPPLNVAVPAPGKDRASGVLVPVVKPSKSSVPTPTSAARKDASAALAFGVEANGVEPELFRSSPKYVVNADAVDGRASAVETATAIAATVERAEKFACLHS